MNRNAREAVRAATEMLATSSDTPALDAELLMAHALRKSRSDVLLNGAAIAEPDSFWPLVERRNTHEPLAYIVGNQPFWTIDLKVAPGVLIPRADSETLIEAAVRHYANKAPPAHIIDIGSGPGTLLLAALSEFTSAQGVGLERSSIARDLAADNAAALGLAARTHWQAGDWTQDDWTKALGGPFDLILCNPPYIEESETLDPTVADYEPHEALFAGADGLDDYRIIIPALADLLTPEGIALVEIGWKQAESVTALATENGFYVTLHHDLGGRDRALLLQKRV